MILPSDRGATSEMSYGAGRHARFAPFSCQILYHIAYGFAITATFFVGNVNSML